MNGLLLNGLVRENKNEKKQYKEAVTKIPAFKNWKYGNGRRFEARREIILREV